MLLCTSYWKIAEAYSFRWTLSLGIFQLAMLLAYCKCLRRCKFNSIAFLAQATAIFAFAHLQQIADPIVFLAAEFLFS